MYKIRYQSRVEVPGIMIKPFIYYPSNASPTLFNSREAAEKAIKSLPIGVYEVISPRNDTPHPRARILER